jgi:magnesium chelatase family protein
MTPRLLDEYAHLTPDCMRVLETAIKRFDMSARAYDRIRKVARTIADLDYANSPSTTPSLDSSVIEAAVSAPILVHHMSEAISYRNLDRSTWGSDTGLPIPLR